MKHTSKIKYRDTKKIFELNPDMKIQTKILDGNIPIVIIDNFYKNPDLVRDIIFETPISYTTHGFDTGFTGRRGNIMAFNDNDGYYEQISKMLIPELNLKSFINSTLIDDRQFLFNIYDEDENTTNPNRIFLPHSDMGVLAALIYLNKEEEGDLVGTGFYRHKESDISCIPQSELHLDWLCKQQGHTKLEYYDYMCKWRPKLYDVSDKEYTTPMTQGNPRWEKLGESSGSYNQVVAYTGGLLHTAMIDYQQLKKNSYTRINQVLFLHAGRHLGGRPDKSYTEAQCTCGFFEILPGNNSEPTVGKSTLLSHTYDITYKDLPEY